MLEKIDYVNLYIASKKMLCDDIFVNPNNGDIYRDCNGYQQRFNEYIRNDKLYIVIDGIMYNKAKLIYDSVNKDNLPSKRYKVIVTNCNIAHPTINNICVADLRTNSDIITNNDENINILLDDIETEINVEYLLSKLAKKEYKVVFEKEGKIFGRKADGREEEIDVSKFLA